MAFDLTIFPELDVIVGYIAFIIQAICFANNIFNPLIFEMVMKNFVRKKKKKKQKEKGTDTINVSGDEIQPEKVDSKDAEQVSPVGNKHDQPSDDR